MLVQWSDHSTELVSRLSRLLATHTMLDITLAAEGRFLKAHKVVLAASSKYFEVSTKSEGLVNNLIVISIPAA